MLPSGGKPVLAPSSSSYCLPGCSPFINDRDPLHHSPFKWSCAKLHEPFISLTSSAFSISFDSRFSFTLYVPACDAWTFFLPTLIISTLHTPDPIFLYRSYILPWHHYRPTRHPFPSSLRRSHPQPTLESRPRYPKSLLVTSKSTTTRHSHSPGTLYHFPKGFGRLKLTGVRDIKRQFRPAGMPQTGEWRI